ncbi:MAG: dienelactone hydrolase family protein [bacterium]
MNVYAAGPLAVAKLTIPASGSAPNKELTVHHPTVAGTYPLVVIQHGFILRSTAYDAIAERMASHGYVVVAPQMYAPSFIGAPSTDVEAEAAETLYTWLLANIDARLPVTVDTTSFGVAGHSRGGKVAWMVRKGGFTEIDAIAGIDPVDSGGGLLSNETRVADAPFTFSLPTLIIGTGLGTQRVAGQQCAPDGDNHLEFWDAAQSPAWHVIAPDYGHLDMVDCGILCATCVSGPDDKFVLTTAGLLISFFDEALKGRVGGYAGLSATAPITLTTESK